MWDNLLTAVNNIFEEAYESGCYDKSMGAVDELYDIWMQLKTIRFAQLNRVRHIDCAVAFDEDLCDIEAGLSVVIEECKRLMKFLENVARDLEEPEDYDGGRFEYFNSRL